VAKYLLRALKNMGEIEIESDSIPKVNLRAREYLVTEFDNAPDVYIEIMKIEESKKTDVPPDFNPQNRAGTKQESPFGSTVETAPEPRPDFQPKNVSKDKRSPF